MSFMDGFALFAGGDVSLPRFCHIGDLTLDLFHHDARVEDSWLALQPDEFELLWQLARAPRGCLSDQALTAARRNLDELARTTEKLRAKLQSCGLADFLIRHPKGYYCLAAGCEAGTAA